MARTVRKYKQVTSGKMFSQGERFLATLMSNLPGMAYRCGKNEDGVWAMDFVSQGCYELTGYQPTDLIHNKTISYQKLIQPGDRKREWKNIEAAVESDRPFELTYRITTATGEEKSVWERGRGIFCPDGQFFSLEGFIIDTTEHRRLEEEIRQARKMEAIGQLAGGVAHDFNNLLTSVMCNSELLLGRLSPSNPFRRHVENIRKAADWGASLTRRLLAFSQRQVLQEQVLNLNHIVREAKGMLRRLIREDIELVVALNSPVGRIKADPGQIENVILNLAINAQEAMPEGGRLTIETANFDLDERLVSDCGTVEPGHYVMLAVSDTGVGMDTESMRHVFEPFFTTKLHGTGLGLSSVYGIVKQSGGSILVSSQPGRGTTIRIYLPRVQEEVGTGTPALTLVKPTDAREVILLVEDEKSVREAIRTLLEESGYEVLEARDGTQAILVAEHHRGPIHLLLSDVVVPGTSARDLVQRISARHSEMKVLYMSGYSGHLIAFQGAQEPGVAFLPKPFSRTVLLRTVRELLDADTER